MALEFGLLAVQASILLALLALGALISTSEYAVLGMSAPRRRQLVDEEHPRIQSVERVLERPRRLLVTVLVTKASVRVGATTLAVLAMLPLGLMAAIVAALLTGVALLTLTDLLPRAFAARNPERLALRTAPALLAFQGMLLPVWWLFEHYSNGVFRLAGARPATAAAQFRAEEDLKTLLALGGGDERFLEEEEEEMIQSVIELGDTTAREVMVPRIDMTTVPGDAKLEHVRAFVLESGFSRIPVYQGNVDNVVGVLYVKDMLMHLVEKRDKANVMVKELMREPFFVPESMGLDDLLKEMRERRVHVVIVVDEFGGTAGMLTLEDILEEIVGEIFDEYDLRHDPVKRLDATTAIVDARTHVADVNDALDIEIPEDEGFDTVAGFVQHQLGRLAREGEVVSGDGFDVVIEKVTNRRILRAKFVKHTAPAVEKAEG